MKRNSTPKASIFMDSSPTTAAAAAAGGVSETTPLLGADAVPSASAPRPSPESAAGSAAIVPDGVEQDQTCCSGLLGKIKSLLSISNERDEIFSQSAYDEERATFPESSPLLNAINEQQGERNASVPRERGLTKVFFGIHENMSDVMVFNDRLEYLETVAQRHVGDNIFNNALMAYREHPNALIYAGIHYADGAIAAPNLRAEGGRNAEPVSYVTVGEVRNCFRWRSLYDFFCSGLTGEDPSEDMQHLMRTSSARNLLERSRDDLAQRVIAPQQNETEGDRFVHSSAFDRTSWLDGQIFLR